MSLNKTQVVLGAAGNTATGTYNAASKALSEADWEAGWKAYKTLYAESATEAIKHLFGIGTPIDVTFEGVSTPVKSNMDIPKICHTVQNYKIKELYGGLKTAASRKVGKTARNITFASIRDYARMSKNKPADDRPRVVTNLPKGAVVIHADDRFHKKGKFAKNASITTAKEVFVDQEDGTYIRIAKEELESHPNGNGTSILASITSLTRKAGKKVKGAIDVMTTLPEEGTSAAASAASAKTPRGHENEEKSKLNSLILYAATHLSAKELKDMSSHASTSAFKNSSVQKEPIMHVYETIGALNRDYKTLAAIKLNQLALEVERQEKKQEQEQHEEKKSSGVRRFFSGSKKNSKTRRRKARRNQTLKRR